MKYEVGDTVIFTDRFLHNAKGTIIRIDLEDADLPYRVKYANTDLKVWVSEEDILYCIEEAADPIPNLLDREVSTLPELLDFVGSTLLKYKNVPVYSDVLMKVDDILCNLVDNNDFEEALALVPSLKNAIQDEEIRRINTEKIRQERIKQLEDELAALKGANYNA